MKQYIDKTALVAEIEKHQAIWDGMDDDYCKGQRLAYSDVISFLDTLEVKEVDLDAEFDKYCETLYLIDLENEPYAELFECAKHFFELGLKTKKE